MTPSSTPVPVVLVSVAERVATITLNRPDARNALNDELRRALRAAMAVVEANTNVDVVVLTGTDPAFCAGLDLKELGTRPVVATTDPGTDVQSKPASANDLDTPHSPWVPLTKPLIGAINGVAITGGLELALQCDFLIASERALFGDTHARVGVLPGWGLSVLLPQAIGYRRAVELSLTGNFMAADEALAFGLVNHVVPHDELMPRTLTVAHDIAKNNTSAVQALLASYKEIHTMTVADGLRHEAKVTREYGATFDAENVAQRREAIAERGRAQL
jgi:enoyl-CoA hydratase